MAMQLTQLADLAGLPHDEIIDVRAPSEFAEDHVPGAINLPVLDDAERARVGTLYKQVSPFAARKLGAALISRNISRHLEAHFADKPRAYRPLIYCWRGGQRSQSMAIILSQIGWRTDTLEGGYKAYRRRVVELLHHDTDEPPAWHDKLILIDGNTGTGKTGLLGALAAAGAQAIDLEGLSHHRGSVFGGFAAAQPSQKAFDSGLAMALSGFDTDHSVFLEAESSRIGRINLPQRLWQAMRDAPRIHVEAGLAARARYLVQAYSDIIDDPDKLLATLARLKPYQPAKRLEEWAALAREGAFEALAAELMRHHYDPTYARQRKRAEYVSLGTVRLSEINAQELARAARDVMAIAGETVLA